MQEFVNKEFNIKLIDINGERSKELFSDRIGIRGYLTFNPVFSEENSYLANFLGLRTSIVKNIEQKDNQLIVSTMNTIYTFELMEDTQ